MAPTEQAPTVLSYADKLAIIRPARPGPARPGPAQYRAALDYSGERYLMTGNLPKAEQRLGTLDKVCTFTCEEYTDLKKAVARYEANGNKYVAAP